MHELQNDFLTALAASYDQQPYFSNVVHWSAPAYLRAAAYLYGLETPPVAPARILELGCAAGGNCIPIASLYPDAEVVGVDISATQIAQGQHVIRQMGLHNIQLLAQCFSQLPVELGQFDYIVAHGVWSWVPEVIQQALLRVCQQHLKPDGAAYISFNTYPGWKLQEVFRDAMLFHGQQFGAPNSVERAREMILFFQHGLAADNPLKTALAEQAAAIPTGAENDYYIAHEYLELHNTPIYLQDFTQRLARYGLRHIGDVETRNEYPQRYGAQFAQHFKLFAHGHKGVARQQYLDFALGRQFRKSLVVHKDFAAQAQTQMFSRSDQGPADLTRLTALQFAGWFELESHTKGVAGQPVVSFYRNLQHESVRVTDPVHRLWVEYLHECWPRPVSGRDLLRLAQQELPHLNAPSHLERLQQWYVQLPLNIARSYDDLPPCLHDLYEGLIPGIYPLLAARAQEEIGMSDFNAWFQSSTARFSSAEMQILRQLAQQDQCPAKEGGSPQLSAEQVDALVANLRKYALYI